MKMKNKLKKVVAYVLSFMMLFTMSAMNIGSVSAASTGSITLNVAHSFCRRNRMICICGHEFDTPP